MRSTFVPSSTRTPARRPCRRSRVALMRRATVSPPTVSARAVAGETAWAGAAGAGVPAGPAIGTNWMIVVVCVDPVAGCAGGTGCAGGAPRPVIVPETAMSIAGALAESLLTVSVASWPPTPAVATKRTVTVHEPPGATVSGQPVAVKLSFSGP